jgi:dihydroorotate dehydrogenase electron transfer subunit
MNYPEIVKIIDTKEETKCTKTIKFEHSEKINPGQFYMIWIPGIDEIPMSVSYIDKKTKGITFRKVGDATSKLFELNKNDKIGIRGPYGKGFEIKAKNIMFVGGGTGVAMISPAIEQAIKQNISATVVFGYKTKDEIFFEKRIKKTGAQIHITTDDGTYGYKGLATEKVEELISENRYDLILTCGPEKMMKKLLDISSTIPLQASLERYMKCGFGICGQCCIGEGLRVCHDGPTFDKKTLKKINDFGKYKKDASGKKIPI